MADISAVKEMTDRLESGMKDLFESDKYTAYLKTMSQFHRYSTRNTLLIHMQMPEATRVAGYNVWKNKFKRQVKKGEHGIKIFAPMPFIVKEELAKLDPVTKQPIIGENGQPEMEEYIKVKSARFKVVTVFDASQTDGEPLPALAETLTGDVARFDLFMDALRAASPLPIVFEDLPPDTDGICHYGDRISIRNGMSEIQTVSAVIHEITHAKLHDLQIITENGENPKDRRTEEVEAESVSYAVSQYYGIETGANSFGYLAVWSKSRELKELNASLDTIRKTSADLIDGIDEQYHALAKERGIDLTVVVEQPAVETITSEPPVIEAPSHNPTPASVPDILDIYSRSTKDLLIGARVLMPPVFIDGNFNRDGKRIYVKVEEPVGKYQLFTHEKDGNESLYLMTASGMIDKTAEYFRDDYNEETHKWENHRPTEAELDAVIPLIAEKFEKDMADPKMWAKYQHAAVLDRIAECDAHNAPVRELRDEQDRQNEAAAELERQEEKQQAQQKYDSRIDEIGIAIQDGKTLSVGYDEYAYDGKNPVLDLFKLYDINIPLRTQGWINSGLAEINADSYRYYKSKHKGDSTAFSGYLKKLREAISDMPIEQKRQKGLPANTEVINTVENRLYEKFAELFPDFASGKYSYMRLESDGFEPLSLEWIFGDRISVMHSYELNGDFCYDPMMEFRFDNIGKTMSACVFQQSIPPLYQYLDDKGIGRSVDGNGNERTVTSLMLQLNDFASQWLDNIAEQGFEPVRANLVLGEDNEVRVTFDEDGNMIMPEPESEEVSPEPEKSIDYSLPDPTVTKAEMNEYGYNYEEMLPLGTDKAVELFNSDHCIYLLYDDDTESLADTGDEIRNHDGLCGIERPDWERSPVRAAQMAIAANAEGSREADLIYAKGNMFGIYQIRDGIDSVRDIRFVSKQNLENHGLSVDRANYELVYTAPFLEQIENPSDRNIVLDKIYQDFNTKLPADYSARSVSVSDVIVLRWEGNVSSHYVDSVGFAPIARFLGNEGNPAIVVPTQSNPELAKLEAEVKAGNSISLMDLSRALKPEQPQPPATKGKPSLLARLDDAKRQVEQNKQQPAVGNKKERGYE